MNRNKSSLYLLIGSGRSGTTWLQDMLTMDFNYRSIFEPLHELQVPIAKKYYNLFLESDAEIPELYNYLFNVFYRRVDNAWLSWMHFGITKNTPIFKKVLQYIYNLPKYKFWAKHRVIKFIKANLMVEYLQQNFDVNIIYLIRHPCAVISSQRKMGWNTKMDRVLSQKNLIEKYDDVRELILSANKEIEKLTVLWCIENSLILNQIRNKRINVVFATYEDIVLNPEGELRRILLESLYPGKVVDRIISRMKRRMPPQDKSIYKWKSKINNEEKHLIINIVKEFNISLYGSEPFPDEIEKYKYKQYKNCLSECRK